MKTTLKQIVPAAAAAGVLSACGGAGQSTSETSEAAEQVVTEEAHHAAEQGRHHGGAHGPHHHGGAHGPHHDGVDRRSMDHHFADAERYAESWNDPERDAWQKPEEIIAAMAISAGATVADLGAGTGYLTPFLSDAVGAQGHVVALDVEPAMITYLETQKEAQGWDNVAARLTTHEDPGLAAQEADAVVTLNVWHHIADRVDFAEKLRAGLTNEGRFVIVDFLPEPTEGHGPPVEMRLAADVVVAELETAGFDAEVIEETLPRHYIVVATPAQ